MPINTYCCNSKIDQNLHLHLGISKVNHQIMALLQCEILQNNMGCTWWEFFFNNNFIRTDFQVLATRVPCNTERASVLKFERFKIASLEQVVLQTCQGQTVRMHVRQALGFDELEYPKYSRMLVIINTMKCIPQYRITLPLSHQRIPFKHLKYRNHKEISPMLHFTFIGCIQLK